MNIICCYNMKGGVGKTTTAINIAYLAAQTGGRTLLWDLDLQGSASFILNASPPSKSTYKIITGKKQNIKKHIQHTEYENLHLLPADFSLKKIDRHLLLNKGPSQLVKRVTEELAQEYDQVIVDCASGFTALNRDLLKATDVILAPVIPTPLGFETLEHLKERLKKDLTDDTLLFPFFSMVDRRKKLHRDILSLHQNGKRGFMHNTIPYSSKAEQMAVHHAPLLSFDTKSAAARAYQALWKEMIDYVGMHDRVKRIKMW